MERHGWNGWNTWHGPIPSRNQEPQKIMQKIENFENLKFVPIIILNVPVTTNTHFCVQKNIFDIIQLFFHRLPIPNIPVHCPEAKFVSLPNNEVVCLVLVIIEKLVSRWQKIIFES